MPSPSHQSALLCCCKHTVTQLPWQTLQMQLYVHLQAVPSLLVVHGCCQCHRSGRHSTEHRHSPKLGQHRAAQLPGWPPGRPPQPGASSAH